MTDLIERLAEPTAQVTIADGWAVVSTGRERHRVPVAHLVEPLVQARHDERIGSESVLDLSAAALRALRAVADRRIERHAATGRWHVSENGRDETCDAFVHAFVTGAEEHQLLTGQEAVTLSVGVSDEGRAHLALAARSSDRQTHTVLRSASGIWAPIERLAAGLPRTDLTDTEVAELIDPALRSALLDAGIQAEWGPGVAPATFAVSLDEDTDATASWLLRIPEGTLSQAEIAELTASQRPLVRVRDSWVVSDAGLLERFRRLKAHPLTAGERAATVLTGTYTSERHAVPLVSTASTRKRLATLTSPPPAVAAPAGLEATLRHYQLDGLAWMVRNATLGLGSCLADDMGLGKTVSAIALHLALRERGTESPTLIVCPASVLNTWEREIRRFAPKQAVVRFHGTSRTVSSGADLVLTTYATLRNDHHVLRSTEWGLLIADEAQMMKNDSSKTARALRSLPGAHRLALSGTPIQNSLNDLWSLLDWTTPGLLGNKRAFKRHFTGPINNGDETPRLQLAKLSRLAVLRRRKDDPAIVPELPAKTITNQVVALTGEQIGLYQAIVDDSLSQIAELDENGRRGRILALLTALKQVCNHPAHYLKEADAPLSNRSGKLDALAEIIDITRTENSPALVFTQFVTMGKLIVRHLLERGVEAEILHGGLDLRERQRLIDAFQAGDLANLVLSTHAAGTGITLTRAEHVIHYDQWWNPAVEDQATDRAHRIGQTHPVYVHRLLCEGTLEERIDAILDTKRALSDSILDNEMSMRLAELDDAALAALVSFSESPS